MKSSDKLAGALEAIPGMPEEIIRMARAGYYGDYTGESPFPQMELVSDLTAIKQQEGMPVTSRKLINAVIRDVKSGEFDGTKEEADEWAASPEGRAAFRELLGGAGELHVPDSRLWRRQLSPRGREAPVLRALRPVRGRLGRCRYRGPRTALWERPGGACRPAQPGR